MDYYFFRSIFCLIVVVGNIISAKMITLPLCDLTASAGLVVYPLTFFLSDFVTEIYGARRAKEMVLHAFGLSLLSYLLIKIALILPGAQETNTRHFEEILGINGVLLFASLTAYFVSQRLDIHLYALIKRWTGERHLWLRNNGSTFLAQLVDTAIVNVIFYHFGLGFGMDLVIPIMIFSYFYKCSFSVVLTPMFYVFVRFFRRPNGKSVFG